MRSIAAEAAAALPPLYAGIAATPAAGDVLLGVAVLDLTAIQVLGSIEGWYNICDEQQHLKGQIKVRMTWYSDLFLSHLEVGNLVPTL